MKTKLDGHDCGIDAEHCSVCRASIPRFTGWSYEDGDVEVTDRDGHIVSETPHMTGGEWAPYGRLIAAAPDLLEAAKSLMACLDGEPGVVGTEYKRRDILRSIIARAEGK